MTKIKLQGDFILASDVMGVLNDIMYSKDPILEAGNFKRDVVHQKHNIIPTIRKRVRPIFYCPDCLKEGHKNKLKTTHTQEYFKLGYPSIRRRKKCLTCGLIVRTIEKELQEKEGL